MACFKTFNNLIIFKIKLVVQGQTNTNKYIIIKLKEIIIAILIKMLQKPHTTYSSMYIYKKLIDLSIFQLFSLYSSFHLQSIT